MSETLATLTPFFPLQLDFFQPGEFVRGKEFDRHVHRKTMPHAIAVSALQGHYEVTCMGSSFTLPMECVALIPANQEVEFVHHLGAQSVIQAQWVHFRFSFHGLVDLLSLFETPLCLPAVTSRDLKAVIAEAQKCRTDSLGPIERHVADLAVASRILQLICSVSPRKKDALESFQQRRFRAVQRYIHQNLAHPISIADLTERSGLSASRFHVLFGEEFGCSPMKYVKAVRLDAVARLLAGSDHKLTHVAALTGFADEFHLSHAFKSRFGMSPRAYRAQASI